MARHGPINMESFVPEDSLGLMVTLPVTGFSP
ncbi:MAG: hypothetical protein RLZZ303_773, partial [Candidatus Hydrogenedentota bacterium]